MVLNEDETIKKGSHHSVVTFICTLPTSPYCLTTLLGFTLFWLGQRAPVPLFFRAGCLIRTQYIKEEKVDLKDVLFWGTFTSRDLKQVKVLQEHLFWDRSFAKLHQKVVWKLFTDSHWRYGTLRLSPAAKEVTGDRENQQESCQGPSPTQMLLNKNYPRAAQGTETQQPKPLVDSCKICSDTVCK